jgi:ABC-type uncharacterized transport system auxiliary subunit
MNNRKGEKMKKAQDGGFGLFRRLYQVALLTVILLLTGCGKPPMLVQKYIFEYSSPVPRASLPLEEGLKVEQFSVAQAYNSTAMIYQANPYKTETYSYSRWRVNPGYMVTDYLVRDLRNSGLFKAVFSSGSAGNSRFVLEGGVEEILEVDEPGSWKAALTLNATLLDVSQKEITKRVVFQRSYRAVEPLPEQTPNGLAQGMSRAMGAISAQIIADVYQAAKRLEK